jgi:hypothetical protein
MAKIDTNLCKGSLIRIGKKEAVRWVRQKLIGLQPKGTCAHTCWLQELISGQAGTCTLERTSRGPVLWQEEVGPEY